MILKKNYFGNRKKLTKNGMTGELELIQLMIVLKEDLILDTYITLKD